ncbi:hypothetical protein NOS3756_55260 [Nostoc sp. NIES-3756]|nr:hypothetical protein NOS3756_55260 [Nostoc sp. NIES-3756]
MEENNAQTDYVVYLTVENIKSGGVNQRPSAFKLQTSLIATSLRRGTS